MAHYILQQVSPTCFQSLPEVSSYTTWLELISLEGTNNADIHKAIILCWPGDKINTGIEQRKNSSLLHFKRQLQRQLSRHLQIPSAQWRHLPHLHKSKNKLKSCFLWHIHSSSSTQCVLIVLTQLRILKVQSLLQDEMWQIRVHEMK